VIVAMVFFATGMNLINSCSVHFGMVQRASGEPSMCFDPVEVAVEQIYRT
jgi:hypothetical protein